MKKQTKKDELVVVPASGTAEIISESELPPPIFIEQEIERAEKIVEALEKIQKISLRLTKEKDWVLMGGAPYLLERGAERIGILWGVNISDVKTKKEWIEDGKGRYYIVIASGKAYARKLNRVVEDIGICSSRDRFFGLVKGKLKPLEEVDAANIEKKAVTNLYSRLIKRVAGLMNIDINDLQAAGLDIEKIPRVEFSGGVIEEKNEKIDQIAELLFDLSELTGRTEEDILRQASGFQGKDGRSVYATKIDQLKNDRWVNYTLQNLLKLKKENLGGEND